MPHSLINGAVLLAHHFDISKAVIGLTLVAIGSSLPEMITVCIASWHKNTDVVIGNILGSNLFNLFSILGVTSLIKPIQFLGQLAQFDVWVMLATSILLIAIIFIHQRVSRIHGIVMLLLYTLYLIWLYWFCS